MPSAPQSESSLCLSCGLCCNGTIFDAVPVAPADALASLHAAGIATTIVDGEPRFGQPCIAHDGRECRVYAHRPAACREYRCDLLKRVEAGAIDYAEAAGVIGEVIRLQRKLDETVREIEPARSERTSRRVELVQLEERLKLSADAEAKRKLGTVMVQMVAMDGYIRRNFGASVLDRIMPKSDRSPL